MDSFIEEKSPLTTFLAHDEWFNLKQPKESDINKNINANLQSLHSSNTTYCTENDEAQTNQAQIGETNQVTNTNHISNNLFINLHVFPPEQNASSTSPK